MTKKAKMMMVLEVVTCLHIIANVYLHFPEALLYEETNIEKGEIVLREQQAYL